MRADEFLDQGNIDGRRVFGLGGQATPGLGVADSPYRIRRVPPPVFCRGAVHTWLQAAMGGDHRNPTEPT